MATHLLYETSTGFNVFSLTGTESVQNVQVQKQLQNYEKFASVCKPIGALPFKSAGEALEAINTISEGLITDNLKAFLKQTFKKSTGVILGVSDNKLAATIQEELSISCIANAATHEIFRCVRYHYPTFAKVEVEDLTKAQLGLGHSYSRSKVKFNVHKVDNMIIQSIATLEQLDKDLNTFVMRIREWYSWHFPELTKIIKDPIHYAKLIKLIEDKANISDALLGDIETIVGDETVAKSVLQAARASMGTEISVIDLESIMHFANRVIDLLEYRSSLEQYLTKKMRDCAPNLQALIGDRVGARLISRAGSLTNLAKYPASTVQILGAEKALFRAMKVRGKTPKYGIIYNSSFINSDKVATKNKGKISRCLANKISIATRIDCFSENPSDKFGLTLKKQVDDRVTFFTSGATPKRNIDVMREVIKEVEQDFANHKRTADDFEEEHNEEVEQPKKKSKKESSKKEEKEEEQPKKKSSKKESSSKEEKMEVDEKKEKKDKKKEKESSKDKEKYNIYCLLYMLVMEIEQFRITLFNKFIKKLVFNHVRWLNRTRSIDGRGRSIVYKEMDSLEWLIRHRQSLPSLLRDKICKGIGGIRFPSLAAMVLMAEMEFDLFERVYVHFEANGIKQHHTILDSAAKQGRVDIVEYLVSRQHPFTNHAVEDASSGGHLSIVKSLLTCDYIQEYWYPSHDAYEYAAKGGHLEVLRYLDECQFIEKNAASSAIDLACQHGHEHVVLYLLENRKDIKYTKQASMFPSTYQMFFNPFLGDNVDMVRFLYQDAMVNPARWDKTPRIHFKNLDTLVNRLEWLPAEFYLDQQNIKDAFIRNDIPTIEYLLELQMTGVAGRTFSLGLVINEITSNNQLAFRVLDMGKSATDSVNLEILPVLAKKGNLELLKHYMTLFVQTRGHTFTPKDREQLFVDAAKAGQVTTAKYLYENEEFIHPTKPIDPLLFQQLVVGGYLAMVEYLLSIKYSSLYVVNADLLSEAALSGDLDMVRCILLSRKGLSLTAKVFQQAITANSLQIVQYLLSKVPKKLDASKYFSDTSFNGAIGAGNIGIIRELETYSQAVLSRCTLDVGVYIYSATLGNVVMLEQVLKNRLITKPTRSLVFLHEQIKKQGHHTYLKMFIKFESQSNT
ncbi:NOP5 family protein [Cavenderia fasciculata]|uniref:Nucleolar protein 56 n=1 Tax=Cavenderia fasciculata TaxID=261658 RepID=F4PIK1_CACFS|nr:NOP5 family protein [Cavenderia fasciculata]EGG24581.1 NOP5 family protein [Cavenderia fasciculata]|eukprot:XP_004362432.1 NOP5 family protein [Cavenderia fasciculata]